MVLAEKVAMIEETPQAPPDPNRKRWMARMNNFRRTLVAAGFLLCLTVGNVIIQCLVVEKNYQVRHWEQVVWEQEHDLMKVKIAIANLESFERVQTVATNELGMKTVGPGDYQMIPAVPAENANLVAPVLEYVAQSKDQGGMLAKVTAWFGQIGKTMAKTL
jgi:cell division protein FtsL